MKPALVVLAAGLGSRFGGDKTNVPLGPGGATLMEYAIFDALRAGFGRAVVVVRAEMRDAVQASLRAKLRDRAPVECVVQALDALPPGFAPPAGRTKPWGTAHAVFTAARRVHEPFAVVNADDVYGAASFATLGAFLAASPTGAPSAYGLAAFPLRDTLSDAGPVNRAVCETDADGWLVRIVERAGVTRADAHGVEGGALVSMNLWGFTPAIFLQLEELLRVFLRAHGANATAEFLLPNAIQSLVHAHRARVRVLQAGGAWCGVTYAADAARVSRHLASLVERGDYPRALWG